MTSRLLRDLVSIPETVHKSDFVVSLSSGITKPEETLGTYVVTPQLATCFDQALSLVGSAVAEGKSKGAYLHGSFGSGKSHFMAVLHLLLQGNPDARAMDGITSVVANHDARLRDRNIMLVPFHFVGGGTVESHVLGGYVKHLRTAHPEADLPPVYASDKILDDAERMREKLGDDVFFSTLNGAATGLEGFGAFGGGSWDAASYVAARDTREDDTRRRQLTADLIATFFESYAELAEGAGGGYVPFDEGLSAITQHAKGLGYDGLLFFLDELILWLASQMTDEEFVGREAAKVSVLVDHSAPRAIPIASLIARQRDLKDFLGEGVAGANRGTFADVLEWSSGRLETITLEDRNLMAIVERRLLKPLNESAAAELSEAFDGFVNRADRALDTLMTDQADRDAFRRTYPFSPALIEVLVGVSAFLQRERTSLKLLLQLLVERRDTLSVGDVVPLGELWDVVESGEEPFDAALKVHFQKARQLYVNRLRPMLLEHHGVDEDAARELPPQHVFHGEDRLAKTLLLAALVPDVSAVKGLTVGRLTDLNHGSVRSPIPGGERKKVLQTLHRWAREIHELQVTGDEQDPMVSLQLINVDVASIIESASSQDSFGARVRMVRDLVGESLGVDTSDALLPSHVTVWRGRRRRVDLAFANIRDSVELPDSEFRSNDTQPKVVIDYPFDPDGKGPSDDLARVQRLRESIGEQPTLCWIPRTLTDKAKADLGRLVVLEYLLIGDRLQDHTSHLPVSQRAEAKSVLMAQHQQMRQHISNVLRMAYGVTAPDQAFVDVDSIAASDQHVVVDPAIEVRPPTQPGLRAAFEHLLDQLFTGIAPEHPQFPDEVRIGELRRTLELVQEAVTKQDRRLDVAQPDRRLLTKIIEPLELGTIGEAHFTMARVWRDRFHRLHENDPGPRTIERLRAWTDEPVPRMLDDEVLNLVVSAYALEADLVLHRDGVAIQPSVEKLGARVELREVALPDDDVWTAAVQRGQSVLGIAVPPMRTASNVSDLAQQARAIASDHLDAVRTAKKGVEQLAITVPIPPDSNRRRALQAAEQLLGSIQTAASDVELVGHIAATDVGTSEAGLGVTIKQARPVANAVASANIGLLELAVDLASKGDSEAVAIRDVLLRDLAHDQHGADLAVVIQRATDDTTGLVRRSTAAAPPVATPNKDATGAENPPPDYVAGTEKVSIEQAGEFLEQLRDQGVQTVTITWGSE